MIAQREFSMAVPLLLAMVAFVLLRYVFQRPFHEAFAIYMALAAFNYYYFFCSKLTGRNPTEVGNWGKPATSLERAQKDIVFFLILGLGLIKLFKNRLEGMPFWNKRLDHPIIKLILVFMGYSIFRTIFSVFTGESTFGLLFYLRSNVEFATIPLLMCTALITREKDLRLVFKGIIYSLPIVAILGIVEFLLRGSPYERQFYGGHIFSRATATLQNPNNLGGYMVTAMGVYILYFFKNQLNKFERWLFWPSMPLGFACLFMTLSRSSILFFFISLTICFAMLYYTARTEMGKERFEVCRNLMVTYILTLGVSVFVLHKYFDLTNAVNDAVDLYVQHSVTSSNRAYAPIVTMGALLTNPVSALFGYSIADWRDISDNAFANILLRNGIIGFLIYISIWAWGLVLSFRRVMDTQSRKSFLYLICFYVLCFQFLYGFTAPVNQNFPHNMYIWFSFGVLAWLESKPAHRKEPASDSRPPALPDSGQLPSPAG